MAEQVEQQVEERAISFRGKKYLIKDLSKEALRCADHIVDLEKKVYVSGLELEQNQH